jgi:hypothetical protein
VVNDFLDNYAIDPEILELLENESDDFEEEVGKEEGGAKVYKLKSNVEGKGGRMFYWQ